MFLVRAAYCSMTKRLVLTLCAALAWSMPATGQDFPSKPIHLIVPYPPGGGTDTIARLISPKLSAALKQPVIVENKPGASTNIATEFVAKAVPDGYTLLLQAPNITTNEALFANLSWSLRDFAGVIQLVRYPNVLLASPGAQIQDFAQLLARAKAAPNMLSYGTPGVASLSHLATELLKSRAGLDIQHVGYKGSAPLGADLLGGHLPLATDNLNNQLSNIRGGKVRALVILSSRRATAAPEVPSLGDFGIHDLEGEGWYGIVVHAKTPPAIVTRLNAEIGKALHTPEVREKIAAMGIDTVGGTPEEFSRHLTSEAHKWAQVIRTGNIRNE